MTTPRISDEQLAAAIGPNDSVVMGLSVYDLALDLRAARAALNGRLNRRNQKLKRGLTKAAKAPDPSALMAAAVQRSGREPLGRMAANFRIIQIEAELAAARADAARLRELLRRCISGAWIIHGPSTTDAAALDSECRRAISTSPSDWLREHDDELIERCEEAVVAISRAYRKQHDASSENIADQCESAIRALKSGAKGETNEQRREVPGL
jgi:hypothetical protein